ncbi:hypothetical protein [Actinomadura viridis]|uniref:Uncharacterized protein n=1 Tax=Actinomadura viridis TaxID=58110 RepID=A0A931GJC7_9ACTN|nr:hypothetical protein [Actinomadura viridis]MBG6089568.1 hypothetical protein [Actinomadura viridis]
MRILSRFDHVRSGGALGVAAALTATMVLAPAGPAAADSCRPALTGVTVPELIHAGDEAAGNVSLSCAPLSEVTLRLSSDRAELVVPATVTVKPGQTSANVPLTARLVDGARYVANVKARYQGRTFGDDITVDPGLKSLSLAPTSAPNAVSPVVSLTGPAPAGGLTVRLASDHPAVTMAPTLFFQQDAYSIVTQADRVDQVTEDTRVTISASLGSRTLRASKVLLPPFDGTQGMNVRANEPEDLYGQEYGRSYSVVLDNPAPTGGLEVQMRVRDGDPAVELDNVTDHISEGSTTGTFRLRTTEVTRTTRVVLEATAAGATATLPITIHPRITAIGLPGSVKGGTAFQGTITLAGPSEVDTVVHLQPSWGIVEVPASVTIPAGAISVTFEATSSTVEEDSQIFITARLGRTELYSDRVTLTP